MAGKIVWTPQAKLDRFDIIEYYFKKDIPRIALKKLDNKIKEIIKLLSRFPDLGKHFGDFEERIIYKEYYSIVYKVLEDKILILHIWDTRRNPEDFPK